MSNVESILALGGMIILAIISLRFNSSVLQTSTADFENKVYLTSFSIADNLIEEIKSKSFDQNTVNFPTTNPASLTIPDSLGPDPGEVKPYYNDVDDYNGYLDTTAAPYFEKYYISCKVEYVTSSNPDVASPTQTFYKKVTVTIKSDYLSNPVSISAIYTLK
jgi:hypothetical protein